MNNNLESIEDQRQMILDKLQEESAKSGDIKVTNKDGSLFGYYPDYQTMNKSLKKAGNPACIIHLAAGIYTTDITIPVEKCVIMFPSQGSNWKDG